MNKDELKEMKKHIFVYHIVPFDSMGIYIAENKEEALISLSQELWDNVDWERLQNPSEEEIKQHIEDMFGTDYSEQIIEKLGKDRKKINIINAIELWTWEEYQAQQGFNISERILEIVC